MCDDLIKHVNDVRSRLPPSADSRALLVRDAAPQHADDGQLDDNGVRVVVIPKNMTHVFQPADQFVIASIKALTQVAWDNWVEEVFSRNSNDTAIAQLTISNLPTVRKRKFAFLAEHSAWLSEAGDVKAMH